MLGVREKWNVQIILLKYLVLQMRNVETGRFLILAFHPSNELQAQKLSGYHSMEKPPKKLLEQVSDVICLKYFCYQTEKSYVNWIGC